MPDPITVTAARGRVAVADLAGLERDAVVLTAEERRWGRRRLLTQAGRQLALALPTGTRLAAGEVLHVGPGWYVAVEAAPEPVLAIRPPRARRRCGSRSRSGTGTSRWPSTATGSWFPTIPP